MAEERVEMFGRAKLENIGKVICKDGEKMLKDYIQRNPESKKLAIEYDNNVIIHLTLLEDNWVRFRYSPKNQ